MYLQREERNKSNKLYKTLQGEKWEVAFTWKAEKFVETWLNI